MKAGTDQEPSSQELERDAFTKDELKEADKLARLPSVWAEPKFVR